MAILRKQQRNQYTVIDQSIFKDSTLSNKALGILCRMLSLPDGWEFSVGGLASLSTDGESAVRSALKELQESGYLRREQRYKDGKFDGYEYIISETKNCDFPSADFPMTENTMTENQAQSNTNISNTNLSNTKEVIYTEFENLWSLYPKKQGKEKAYSCYERARKSGTTCEEVEQGIYAYKDYIKANSVDMQYIKMGSTFFSQKAWQGDWVIRTNKTETRHDLFERLMREYEDD